MTKPKIRAAKLLQPPNNVIQFYRRNKGTSFKHRGRSFQIAIAVKKTEKNVLLTSVIFFPAVRYLYFCQLKKWPRRIFFFFAIEYSFLHKSSSSQNESGQARDMPVGRTYFSRTHSMAFRFPFCLIFYLELILST